MSEDEPTHETFHYRIDGGEERCVTVATGIYVMAVMAIPALTGHIDLPFEIEIWCPRLLPHYGPYRYEIYNGEFGFPAVRYLVLPGRAKSAPPASSETKP